MLINQVINRLNLKIYYGESLGTKSFKGSKIEYMKCSFCDMKKNEGIRIKTGCG